MSQPLCLENLPRTVELERDGDGRPRLAYIDQRRLPGELAFERTGDWRAVVGAVKSLAVRGAPALGIAGAAAVALWAGNVGAGSPTAGGCQGRHPRASSRSSAAWPTKWPTRVPPP
ncbi:MAG: hypothetical protein V8S24_15200 [Gordonibacter pamelaeae]